MFQVIWVELPVLNIERAMKFYQTMFEIQPTEISADGTRRTTTLINVSPEGFPGISLTETKGFEPSSKGTWVYFNAGEDLATHLSRVEPAGGKIVTPKTDMGGGAGFYASVEDTEGNVIALYSTK